MTTIALKDSGMITKIGIKVNAATDNAKMYAQG